MRITLFVTPEALQFNLDPQGEHERELLDVIAKYDGQVHIAAGAHIGTCKGHYVRQFSADRTPGILAITIEREPPPPEPKD